MSKNEENCCGDTAVVSIDPEVAVRDRYAKAAQAMEPALCCPTSYNAEYLKAIPDAVIERDYGCGDPSEFVRPGETVLDLGSGGGKLCFIASQVVGPKGHVIGVDCNSEMLALARENQPIVAERIGFSNIDFRCGHIQDLRLDLDKLVQQLGGRLIGNVDDLLATRELEEKLRQEQPLIEENSVDCVVSNCVLNLVRPEDRRQLFAEIFRVLKPGGRAAISDIVASEDVPEAMQRNPDLWSGCISGAWEEEAFIEEFGAAGFVGMTVAKRQAEPWQVVEGIEFRSMTIIATKKAPSECAACDDTNTVIYRGPFQAVQDDEGHAFYRGERTSVCDETLEVLKRAPYSDAFIHAEGQDGIAQPQGDSSDSCCSGDSCC